METGRVFPGEGPGSRLVRLKQAGHFPATERPDEVNRLIEEFLASL